jgi:hypothetical protein
LLECWNNEQSKRPSIHEVVNRLILFILNSNNAAIYQQNEIFIQTNSEPNENLSPNSSGNSLHGELSQMIQILIL